PSSSHPAIPTSARSRLAGKEPNRSYVRRIFAARTSEVLMLTRRLFLATALTACTRAESPIRLRTRPAKSASAPGATGVNPLHLRSERDALVYIPASAPDPAPFVLYLHGATGSEQQG